jgi:hypothetical protein
VFCNLINMIVDLVEYIKKKATAAMSFLTNHGTAMLDSIKTGFASWQERRGVEMQRRANRIAAAETGKPGNLGDYCTEDKHCVSGRCTVNLVTRNECSPSPKQPEYRAGGCNNHLECHSKTECKERSGCKWKGGKILLDSMFGGISIRCKCTMPDKIQAPVPLRLDEGAKPDPTHKASLLESGARSGLRKSQSRQHVTAGMGLAHVSDLALARDDAKLAMLEMRDLGHPHPKNGGYAHLTQEQKHNRATYNLHAAGAFDNRGKFLDKHLFTGASAQKIFTGAISYLQLSARAHESARARAASKALGLIKLPNRCVNAEAIGKTITLAINYENPALFKCLMAIPFVLSECMPEVRFVVGFFLSQAF